MIMDVSRKYRKWVFWILIILVGVPFIFITTDYIPFADRLRQMPADYGVIASVGDTPVMADEFRQQLDAQMQPQPGQPTPTYADMYASGQAEQAIQSLISSKLFEQEASKVGLAFDQSYLVDQLKKERVFQNAQGEFDPEAFNTWVNERKEQNENWNPIWEQVGEGVRRRILGQRITASARVREEELRKEFEKQNTKVKVKYLTIEPKITPTEEQVKAHYEANKQRYEIPAKRKAQFVSISIEPPRPTVLDDFYERAKKGEDFEALAKTTSPNINIQNVPDTGWIAQDKAQPGQEVLFTLKTGDISEPVKTPFGYSIYKILEERTGDKGQKEVRAQELAVYPSLTPEEQRAANEKIEAVAKQAKTGGDLTAAALQASMPVHESGQFSIDSKEIENVAKDDVAQFARGLASVDANGVSDVIRGRKNLYVAKVLEVEPPVPQPLEAVREKVVEDTVAELKRAPESQEKVQALAAEIPSKAKKLEEIKALYPTLDNEIKEVGPFTAKGYEFSQGPFWNPQELVDQLIAAGPGKLVGPVRDFMGGIHFAELVDSTPPDEKSWNEAYPKEKTQIEKMLLAERERERFDDYLAFLKQSTPLRMNPAAIEEALGLNKEKEKTAEAPEGAGVPAPALPGTGPTPPVAPAPLAPAVSSPPAPTSNGLANPVPNEAVSAAPPASATAPSPAESAPPPPPVEAPPPAPTGAP